MGYFEFFKSAEEKYPPYTGLLDMWKLLYSQDT